MSLRTLAALIGLIVAIGLYLLVSEERDDSIDAVGELFLPELNVHLNDIDTVRIVKAGDRTIATIARGDSRWTISNEAGYPADIGRIRELLIALSQARIVELKTARPELHERLGVEDITRDDAGGTLIELTHKDESIAIILGNRARANGDTAYARRAGQDQSALISAAPDPGTSSADWLDRNIVDIAVEDIESIEVVAADGSAFTIRRSEDNPGEFELLDAPVGRTLDATAVRSLSGVLTSLEFDSVESDSASDLPADSPETTTIFRTRKGLVVTATATETQAGTRVIFDANQAAPSGDAADVSDASANATELRSRWSGWRYSLPGFKADQFTRTVDDILTPEN